MKRFLVAKKLDDDEIIYVSGIAKNKTSESLNCWEALDFKDKDTALYVSNFLNTYNNSKSTRYKCVELEYTVTMSDGSEK